MFRPMRKKLVLALLAVMCAPVLSSAQVGTLYGFGQSAGTYTPVSGGTLVAQGTFNDAVASVSTSPFFFGGTYYDSVHVSTNGFCTVGGAAAASNYFPISGSAVYGGAISPFGANLQNAAAGTPEVRVVESGGEIIVQWQDVMRAAAGAEQFSFQARINTSTGVVRFVHSAVTNLDIAATSQPEVGLRGNTNAFANVKNRRVSTGTETWAATLAGTTISNKMRFTATAPAKSPNAGQTYTFTPTCLSPQATTSTSSDCSANSFYVQVQVTSLGSAANVDIIATPGGVLHNDVGLGSYTCGPFTLGTAVALSVAHSGNAACTNPLGSFNPATVCATVANGVCLEGTFPLIPDNGCGSTEDLQVRIPISGLNTTLGNSPGQTFLQSIEIIVAHTYRGDLQIRLTSPSGQTRDLFIQQPTPESEGSNLGNPSQCPGVVVQFRDDAPTPLSAMNAIIPNVSGAFQPQQSLSGFTGNANGDWVLRICDASPEDAGWLSYIRLRLRNVDCLGVLGGTALPGTACNDGNASTTNDMYGTDCVCAGTGAAGVAVAAKVFLEGCYDQGTGLMHDSLRTRGLIPAQEPYTSLGFTLVGGGGEQVQTSVLTTAGSTAIVDWVVAELRSAINGTVLHSVCALVRRDGQVVSTAGSGAVIFPGFGTGSYHVAIRHRNHLGTMTLNPVTLSATSTAIDLTSAATGTFGMDARKPVGGIMVLWGGNVLGDGTILYVGQDNDRDPILVSVGGSTPNNTITGYTSSDVNMDGVVKYIGAANDRDPILLNVGGSTPNNVRLEQLP